VLEAVFILLEILSPSRRIFIGSHSLPRPPLWFAVSVLQGYLQAKDLDVWRVIDESVKMVLRRKSNLM
jgi:hypothetical protein